MTDENALRWYVPPGAVKLYALLREQGDTPDEAVGNVLIALQVIMRHQPFSQTRKKRSHRERTHDTASPS